MTRRQTPSEADVQSALAMLPEQSFVRVYARYAEAVVGGPSIYHATSALALLGASAHRELTASGGFSATTPANFYGVIAGPSGSRKSLAVRTATNLLTDAAPSLLGSDPESWSDLVSALSVQPSQFLPYPEFGLWMAQNSRASVRSHTLRHGVASLFDGFDVHRRAGGRDVVATAPRLSILGATTPEALLGFSRHEEAGGLLSRFFFAAAEVPTERQHFPDLQRPELRQWLADMLLCMSTQARVAPCEGLSPEAKDAWNAWRLRLQARSDDTSDFLWSIIVRAPAVASRVVLLLSWASGESWGTETKSTWPVSKATIEAAIAFTELHLLSARALLTKQGVRWSRSPHPFKPETP